MMKGTVSVRRQERDPYPGSRDDRGGGAGKLAVALMVGLGVVLAAYGVFHQREQTRRCLVLFGVDAARRIATADQVQLLRVRAADDGGRLEAVSQLDISSAAGLVHLRRGLVEDANYAWSSDGTGPIPRDALHSEPGRSRRDRLPLDQWDWAIAFSETSDSGGQGGTTVLVIDLPAKSTTTSETGWLAVVGRPGRVALGRLGQALEEWIAETGEAASGGGGGLGG